MGMVDVRRLDNIANAMAGITTELEPLASTVEEVVEDPRHAMSLADLLEMCSQVVQVR